MGQPNNCIHLPHHQFITYILYYYVYKPLLPLLLQGRDIFYYYIIPIQFIIHKDTYIQNEDILSHISYIYIYT